jgi:hypothetical protein
MNGDPKVISGILVAVIVAMWMRIRKEETHR